MSDSEEDEGFRKTQRRRDDADDDDGDSKGASSDEMSEENEGKTKMKSQFVPSSEQPTAAVKSSYVSMPKKAAVADPFAKDKPAAASSKKPQNVKYSMFTKASTGTKSKDKEFANWEKHTKGIGMKLLQKMGFEEGKGLGIARQGIVQPIEVKVRAKNRALQDEDERTKQSKTQFPTEDPDASDRMFQQQLQQWRVEPGQRRKRPKYTYKTAEELSQELSSKAVQEVGPSKVKVLDMTGPTTRVLSGYSEISSEARTTSHLPVLSSADGSVPMPEFQHNLNQLVEMAASEIQRVGARLRRERDTVLGLSHDKAELSERVAKETTSVTHLKDIVSIMQTCVENPALSLKQCLDAFELLRARYSDEYKIYGLSAFAPALAFPLVKRSLSNWLPLQSPEYCGALLAPWQALLQGDETVHNVGGRAMDSFERLCWDIVMPPLRMAFGRDWSVRFPAPAVRLLLSLECLPQWMLENIRTQLVLPRLAQEVDAWDPRRDTMPIHAWLQPWVVVLGSALQVLYPPIRFKLASCLQAWHPSDPSALAIISPWQGVWAANDMYVFLSRAIVPKLSQAIRDMPLDPQRPQLEALGWVAAWRKMLLLSDVVTIFEKSFCHRFLTVLCEWLNMPSANYEDIAQWYTSWKGQFDEELQAQTPLRVCFSKALDLMERAMTGETVAPVSPPRAGPAPPPIPAAFRAPALAATRTQLSLRDLVQQMADRCGVVFAPRSGPVPEGKSLYSFGRAAVYLDRGVVFARVGDGFQPVSLDALADLA